MQGMLIKLYPNKLHRTKIKEHADAARYVYNYCLNLRQELHKNKEPTISKFDMITHVKELKDTSIEHTWLKQVHSQVLQQSIIRLDKSYKSFFRRVKLGGPAGFPKFKSRRDSKHTFDYPQGIKFNDVHSKIYLPRIGWIKCRGVRPDILGNIKTVTISLHQDGLITASLLIDNENQVSINNNTKVIGLDVGVKKFVTDSNGNKTKPLNLNKEIANIKYLQVLLSQSKRGSNNKNRIRARLAKAYRHLSNKRTDFIHHVANKYIDYKFVYVEDLNIKLMTKNTVGTIDNPNMDSKRKSRLNNAVTNQAWGEFFLILEYKLKDRKSVLHKVDPKYTSQMCNNCKLINKASRNGENYRCLSCNHTMDADVNAAKNIRDKGYAELRPAA